MGTIILLSLFFVRLPSLPGLGRDDSMVVWNLKTKNVWMWLPSTSSRTLKPPVCAIATCFIFSKRRRIISGSRIACRGGVCICTFIIHQTHYEKSDWSRAFNQFTIACELDMINAISAADIAFIMSSSTSAWLLSPLECSQKQNGWTLRFCFWGWIMWKMYNKTIIEFGFRMISWIIKTSCLCYLPQPSASADNTDLAFDNSWYHAQPHPIIV